MIKNLRMITILEGGRGGRTFRGAPKGGAPKGGAPNGGGPKISRFFPSLATFFFHSSLSWDVGGVCAGAFKNTTKIP